MIIRGILCLLLVLFTAGGCSSAQNVDQKPPVHVVTPQESMQTPTQGDGSVMPLPTPWLTSLIESAKGDLASRLSIGVTDISLVSAEEVVWGDSSLGCPQEGIMYAQILNPGYRIVLEYAGNHYEYHAGKAQVAVYCDNPTPPVPDEPGNT